VKEDPNLVTNEKRRRRFPCLVANGRRRRRFPCFVANGRRRRRKRKSSPGLVANGKKRKRERSSFSPLFIFPPTNFTQTFIFSFDLKLLFYHGSRPLLMHFLPFPWPINYDYASRCHKSFPHSLPIWFWLKIYFPFLKIMVSRMATSYRFQTTQMNEKSALESSLNLILMQHPCDENPNPQEVHACFEVDPFWT